MITSETKSAFIGKIYTLLSIQLMTTWIMSYVFYTNEAITNFVINTPGALITSTLFTFLFLFLSSAKPRRPHRNVEWGSDVAIFIMPLAIVEHNSYSSVSILDLESITIPQVKPFCQGLTITLIELININLFS